MNYNYITTFEETPQEGHDSQKTYKTIVRDNDKEVGSFEISGQGFGGKHTMELRISILPPYQRKGLSRQLIKKTCEYLKANTAITDTQLLFIDVDASDGFWQHIGMEDNDQQEWKCEDKDEAECLAAATSCDDIYVKMRCPTTCGVDCTDDNVSSELGETFIHNVEGAGYEKKIKFKTLCDWAASALGAAEAASEAEAAAKAEEVHKKCWFGIDCNRTNPYHIDEFHRGVATPAAAEKLRLRRTQRLQTGQTGPMRKEFSYRTSRRKRGPYGGKRTRKKKRHQKKRTATSIKKRKRYRHARKKTKRKTKTKKR